MAAQWIEVKKKRDVAMATIARECIVEFIEKTLS